MAKGKRGKSEIFDPNELTREWLHAMNSVFDGKDTTQCVILSVAYLERILDTILSSFFIKSDTSDRMLHCNGSLGNFRTKSDLCYVLAFVPKPVAQMLWIMGEIRNTVAHSHRKLTFDNEELRNLLVGSDNPTECLVIPEDILIVRESGGGLRQRDERVKAMSNPTEKFQTAVYFLINVLWTIAGGLGTARRKLPNAEPYAEPLD